MMLLYHMHSMTSIQILIRCSTEESTKVAVKTENAYASIKEQATPNKRLIPAIHWYGTNNQFHNWITNFIQGDFGTSFQDGRPVKSVIWGAVRWTLILSFISIVLTYLISIPLGITSAANKDNLKTKVYLHHYLCCIHYQISGLQPY